MVGDDQITDKMAGGAHDKKSGGSVNKIISRWGDLETSRSVVPKSVWVAADPEKTLKTKVFAVKTWYSIFF